MMRDESCVEGRARGEEGRPGRSREGRTTMDALKVIAGWK